jgi:hypothetical protein
VLLKFKTMCLKTEDKLNLYGRVCRSKKVSHDGGAGGRGADGDHPNRILTQFIHTEKSRWLSNKALHCYDGHPR